MPMLTTTDSVSKASIRTTIDNIPATYCTSIALYLVMMIRLDLRLQLPGLKQALQEPTLRAI